MTALDALARLCRKEAVEALPDVCRRHGVKELALFGSALDARFGPGSDLDFLVEFEPTAEKPWMGEFFDLEGELHSLFGRRIDLVSKRAVVESKNWIRRRAILESARVLYAA